MEEERRNKKEEKKRKNKKWQMPLDRNVGYDTAFFFPAWYVYLFIFNAVLLHTVCIVTPVNNDRESRSGYVTKKRRKEKKRQEKERKKERKERNVRREELFRDLPVFSPGKDRVRTVRTMGIRDTHRPRAVVATTAVAATAVIVAVTATVTNFESTLAALSHIRWHACTPIW